MFPNHRSVKSKVRFNMPHKLFVLALASIMFNLGRMVANSIHTLSKFPGDSSQ